MDASGSKRQAKFAFVTVQPRDAGKEGGRSRAARSHAASVGYRKSQLATKSKTQRAFPRSEIGADSVSSQQRRRHDSASSITSVSQYQPDEDQHVSNAVALPLTRTLSPTFGAGGLSTFDVTSDSFSAGTGSFMASVVWPVVAGDAISRRWFEDFCTSPIVFHAHCTAGDTYLAYLENDLTHINNNRTLVHKSKAINLIRQGIERIAAMGQREKEKLIFGMMILSNHEVEPRHLEDRDLPFRPHLPSANWFRCWGRTDAIEAHERTAFFLINQLGGLKALQMPGLAPMAALVDIFRRSSAVHDIRPDFDCYWDLHVSDLLPDYYESIVSSPPSQKSFASTPGAGFSRLANVLPAKAISLFSDLACLDMVMSQCLQRHSTSAKEQRFLDVRNAIIHRLLSLPSWNDLPAYEQDRTNRLLYRICCTTCLVYSNGAMLPMPPHNGWNARLTTQIRKLLEKTDMSYWHSSMQSLLLWTILISGMAAYETENRSFFEQALENYLSLRPLTYEQAISEVKNFIWSDSVCEIGSRELWKASSQRYDSPVV